MDEIKVFDYEGAMDRVDNDQALLWELVDIFCEDLPTSSQALENAVQARSAKGIEEVSHSMKSALGNIGATRCYQLALNLEKMGRDQSIASAPATYEQLKKEIQVFLEEVKRRKG